MDFEDNTTAQGTFLFFAEWSLLTHSWRIYAIQQLAVRTKKSLQSSRPSKQKWYQHQCHKITLQNTASFVTMTLEGKAGLPWNKGKHLQLQITQVWTKNPFFSACPLPYSTAATLESGHIRTTMHLSCVVTPLRFVWTWIILATVFKPRERTRQAVWRPYISTPAGRAKAKEPVGKEGPSGSKMMYKKNNKSTRANNNWNSYSYWQWRTVEIWSDWNLHYSWCCCVSFLVFAHNKSQKHSDVNVNWLPIINTGPSLSGFYSMESGHQSKTSSPT